MAETEHSAAAAHEPQAERELTIDLRPHGWSMWWFDGTRAQLEAEGVIPPGTEWPATGNEAVGWTAGPLEFRLRRIRPPGLKGPMRLWISGDWWRLRCEPVNRLDGWQQQEAEAERELRRVRYFKSPAGQRALHVECQRRYAAERDAAFQAFKALVPGLIPPRRGRRAGGAAGAVAG